MAINRLFSKPILFFVLVFFAICGPGCGNSTGCLTADTITLLKTMENDGRSFLLYFRTSGFQEKEIFLELYGGTVKFDECGKSNLEPLDTAHVDLSQGQVEKIIVKNNKITIAYGPASEEPVNLLDIPVITP